MATQLIVPNEIKLSQSEPALFEDVMHRTVYKQPLNKNDFSITESAYETINFAIPKNGHLLLTNSYFPSP